MADRRKWIPGPRIEDPMLAFHLILSGHVIFDRHKAQNAKWMQNQSLIGIASLASSGCLRFAIPNEKGKLK